MTGVLSTRASLDTETCAQGEHHVDTGPLLPPAMLGHFFLTLPGSPTKMTFYWFKPSRHYVSTIFFLKKEHPENSTCSPGLLKEGIGAILSLIFEIPCGSCHGQWGSRGSSWGTWPESAWKHEQARVNPKRFGWTILYCLKVKQIFQ